MKVQTTHEAPFWMVPARSTARMTMCEEKAAAVSTWTHIVFGSRKHTVEAVREAPAGRKLSPLHDRRGHEPVQQRVDEVVRQHVPHHAVAVEPRDPVLGPAHLALERLEVERPGAKERGS